MGKEVVNYFTLVAFLFLSFLFLFFAGRGITGFVVFSDSSEEDFSSGEFFNTYFNGSSVVLEEEYFSGVFISRIFDAGFNSTLQSVDFSGEQPEIYYIYAVDGGGNVFSSANDGLNWTQKVSNYGRTSDTQEMFSDDSYLYIISNSNREVWRSSNLGVNWSVVNKTFADSGLLLAERDSLGNLFVIDASGDVYFSDDSGVSWELRGDFNGASTNNGKGFALDSEDVLYVVQANGEVFASLDGGFNWEQKSTGYGGGAATGDLEIDSLGRIYILFNKAVYMSDDSGVSWEIVNNSFTSFTQDGSRMFIDGEDKIFIADNAGRVFVSENYGVDWELLSDFNEGASSTPKGLTSFYSNTSLSFEVRACQLDDCSDSDFLLTDLSEINLTGRYFQYRVNLNSLNSEISPYFYEVTLNYIQHYPDFFINIHSPLNFSYDEGSSIDINFSFESLQGEIDSCWYNLNEGEDIFILNCANSSIGELTLGNYVLDIFANNSYGVLANSRIYFSVLSSAEDDSGSTDEESNDETSSGLTSSGNSDSSNSENFFVVQPTFSEEFSVKSEEDTADANIPEHNDSLEFSTEKSSGRFGGLTGLAIFGENRVLSKLGILIVFVIFFFVTFLVFEKIRKREKSEFIRENRTLFEVDLN